MSKYLDRIDRARIQLVLGDGEAPDAMCFFGTLAMHLTPVEDERVLDSGGHPTLATDGVTLRFHPAAVGDGTGDSGLKDAELVGVVAHEVMHCAAQHLWRRGGRERVLWNVAADMVVNQALREAGITLPDGVYYPPPEIAEEPVEITYEWLRRQQVCGGKGGKGGEGEGIPKGKLVSSHEDWGKQGKGGQGGDDKTPQEREGDWKVHVAAAAATLRQKCQGSLPAGLERLVGSLLAPRIDWRTVLARFLVSLSCDDYSYRRVRAAYTSLPGGGMGRAYLPRLCSEKLRLAVALDTSGSITDAQHAAFLSEVAAMLYGQGGSTELHLYACDAAVHMNTVLTPQDDLPVKFGGGGGTSFIPVFEQVEEDYAHEEPPAALVYFTDSWGDFPAVEPDYPVLWIVDAPPSQWSDIPFGESVPYESGAPAVWD